jgi:hypothetical protein
MRPRRLRIWLVSSPIAAITAQLLLAATAAASTGGGDFPRLQAVMTFV